MIDPLPLAKPNAVRESKVWVKGRHGAGPRGIAFSLFSLDPAASLSSSQLIPQISSLSWFTTIVPLVLVLTITAVKDATDDYVSGSHCHSLPDPARSVLSWPSEVGGLGREQVCGQVWTGGTRRSTRWLRPLGQEKVSYVSVSFLSVPTQER